MGEWKRGIRRGVGVRSQKTGEVGKMNAGAVYVIPKVEV